MERVIDKDREIWLETESDYENKEDKEYHRRKENGERE